VVTEALGLVNRFELDYGAASRTGNLFGVVDVETRIWISSSMHDLRTFRPWVSFWGNASLGTAKDGNAAENGSAFVG
jgi:hypothetical protein